MPERHPTHPRLFRCEVCGEWAGIINRRFLRSDQRTQGDSFTTVLCSCDGPSCRRCGVNRIHRPISNWYDEADDSVWHVPYFAGLAPCARCRAEDRE